MKYTCAASIAILFCVYTAASQGALIHPDVTGATVKFTNIEESSPSGDPLPLYGQPSANGNELIFPTTGDFSASSHDGVASDQTDGKLSLMVVAKPGNFIDSFQVEENGLTTLNAPFGGDAFTQAITFAVVKIAEINGAPVNIPAMNVFLTVTPLGGSYQLSLIGGSSYATGWTGHVALPVPVGTTKMNVILNNNLFAATQGSGTRAFIDKKAFEIDIHTHGIPEPATLILAIVSALIGVATRSRVRG